MVSDLELINVTEDLCIWLRPIEPDMLGKPFKDIKGAIVGKIVEVSKGAGRVKFHSTEAYRRVHSLLSQRPVSMSYSGDYCPCCGRHDD